MINEMNKNFGSDIYCLIRVSQMWLTVQVENVAGIYMYSDLKMPF